MIIGVDHILIAVENMDQAVEVYRRLGFQVLPGGEHPRMGTFNSLVPLSDGAYLELIGVKNRQLAEQFPNSRHVVRALERVDRIATFALETNDLPSDVAALRARGLDIGDPIEGERMRPDGQRVAWFSAHFQDPNLPFLFQDVTPRHLRVPPPEQGLGQQAYLSELEILAASVPDTSRVWKDLLGFIPEKDDAFKLERCTIRIRPNDGRPTGLGVVQLAVRQLDDAIGRLQAGGVEWNRRDGRVEIDPHSAAGARITLVGAS